MPVKTKQVKAKGIMTKQQVKAFVAHTKNNVHKIKHKFYSWLIRKYGKGCVHTIKFHKKELEQVDLYKLHKKLIGHDVMEAIEKYVNRYAPEIKLVYTDDDRFTSSLFVIIPHPSMGVSTLFVPQQSNITSYMFFHTERLLHLAKVIEQVSKKHLENTAIRQYVKANNFFLNNGKKLIYLKIVTHHDVRQNSKSVWLKFELDKMMKSFCYVVCDSNGVIDWNDPVYIPVEVKNKKQKEYKFQIITKNGK